MEFSSVESNNFPKRSSSVQQPPKKPNFFSFFKLKSHSTIPPSINAPVLPSIELLSPITLSNPHMRSFSYPHISNDNQFTHTQIPSLLFEKELLQYQLNITTQFSNTSPPPTLPIPNLSNHMPPHLSRLRTAQMINNTNDTNDIIDTDEIKPPENNIPEIQQPPPKITRNSSNLSLGIPSNLLSISPTIDIDLPSPSIDLPSPSKLLSSNSETFVKLNPEIQSQEPHKQLAVIEDKSDITLHIPLNSSPTSIDILPNVLQTQAHRQKQPEKSKLSNIITPSGKKKWINFFKFSKSSFSTTSHHNENELIYSDDYLAPNRLPLDVEKRIYKSSHLKLASPRPLDVQVRITNLILYILSVHADVTLSRQRGKQRVKRKIRKASSLGEGGRSKGSLMKKSESMPSLPVKKESDSSDESDESEEETSKTNENSNSGNSELVRLPGRKKHLIEIEEKDDDEDDVPLVMLMH